MKKILLVQLPIPHLNFAKQTGNIPLGAACLKCAAKRLQDINIEIIPESIASYLGDAALIKLIKAAKPDIIGFTVYCWNVERSLYFASRLKENYNPKIIFGGPEITPDNKLIFSEHVDFLVFGEGEAVFIDLIKDQKLFGEKSSYGYSGDIFKKSLSPYLENILEPWIENMMLLETQRGCPYRCGFCYYNKSMNKPDYVDEETVLKGVSWAVENKIKELYLLDPSLNARPKLKSLLKKIAVLNRDKSLSLFSEIRAEAIDEELANLFMEAGFSWFEIGLQSTNPLALKLMNRPSDLKKIVNGVSLLKERKIIPGIDLIVGLPGDDLENFKQSVNFVAENNMTDDIQAFPLSVLPGTYFRQKSNEFGLLYEASPPYNIISTPGFSMEDLLLSFDYAETRFDITLYPMPDIDVSYLKENTENINNKKDYLVRIGDDFHLFKLMLNSQRKPEELKILACKVTQPYQIFVYPSVSDPAYIGKVLKIFTSTNPFTPFELVFFEPEKLPDTRNLLNYVHLVRPHFLDNDLRFSFSRPGNRAVMFTLVSRNEHKIFNGDMERQVFWWRHKRFPEMNDLNKFLLKSDGVLIDVKAPESSQVKWQDQFYKHAGDLPFICFARTYLQKRWLNLTAPDEYYFDVMNHV